MGKTKLRVNTQTKMLLLFFKNTCNRKKKET